MMAACFCFSIVEALLPDPCPSDCAGIESVETVAAYATAMNDAPESQTQQPAGPAACHCAHAHVTRIAIPFHVTTASAVLIAAPRLPIPNIATGLGRAAPPVPPPLA
jgi:hypothetical protein